MNFLRKVLNFLFVCGVVVFMTLGTVIVLVQAYSIVTANGALAVKAMKTVGKPAFIIASLTGVLGFVQGYINGWEMGD
ncbi:MAG TPA: hypothetical protein VN631_17480 [Negativicutes bacterium]|nr:hypothetical protein [Negativicutes bacterium]